MDAAGTHPLLFEFESADSLAQFMAWIVPIAGGGTILGLLAWKFGWWHASVGVFLACVLCVVGLRCRISVYRGHVRVVRKWFFLTYKTYSADAIEGVSYGGDYDAEEGAAGVVVKMGGQEVHIGTSRNMRYLHDALCQVAYSGMPYEAPVSAVRAP